MTLRDFATTIGAACHVQEYDGHWTASLESTDILDCGFLLPVSGDGDTPEAAVRACAAMLAGHHVVKGATSPSPREYTAPRAFDVERP